MAHFRIGLYGRRGCSKACGWQLSGSLGKQSPMHRQGCSTKLKTMAVAHGFIPRMPLQAVQPRNVACLSQHGGAQVDGGDVPSVADSLCGHEGHIARAA